MRCTKKSLTSAFPVPTMGFVRCSNHAPAGEGSRKAPGNGQAARSGFKEPVALGDRTQLTMKGTLPCTTLPNNSPNSTRPTSRKRRSSPRSRIENAEKLVRLNLNAAKVVLAQGVEGATAAVVGQGRAGPDGAARQVRRDGRADRDGLLEEPLRDGRRKRKRNTRRSPKKRGRRTRRASRRGSRRPASRPRPVRTRLQRVQVDGSPRRPPRSTSSRRRRSKS